MEPLGIARSPTGAEPKCVRCRHYKLYPPDPALLKSSPQHRCARIVDLVTDRRTETDCHTMRHPWGECGWYGKLFEDAPRPPPPPPPPPPLPPTPPEWRFWWTVLDAFLVLATLAILAHIIWWTLGDKTDQPRVIKTGEVSVRDGSCCVTTRTRLLVTDKRSLWQFEASPGVWENCGADCEKAWRRMLAE